MRERSGRSRASARGAFAPGVEPFLRQRAAEDKRAIEHLEFAADFAALLDSVDPAIILRTMTPLFEPGAPKRTVLQIAEMHRAWSAEDALQFDRVFSAQPLMQIPQLRAALLDRRNEHWLPKIEALLSSREKVLIAVGAGHLGGEHGLLSLLRQRGINTTRCV
jgi:uncharacterized protein